MVLSLFVTTKQNAYKEMIFFVFMSCVFPDTDLLVIVKDSLTRLPRVRRSLDEFIRDVVPYVENARIFDTGSTDGTLEVLEGYQSEFPNLHIYSVGFDGFANARNFAMEMARVAGDAKYFLVLDDDERIDVEANVDKIVAMKEVLDGDSSMVGSTFKFYERFANGGMPNKNGNNHNVRFFKNLPEVSFKDTNGEWEYLYSGDEKLVGGFKGSKVFYSGMFVTHFLFSEYEDYEKYGL